MIMRPAASERQQVLILQGSVHAQPCRHMIMSDWAGSILNLSPLHSLLVLELIDRYHNLGCHRSFITYYPPNPSIGEIDTEALC